MDFSKTDEQQLLLDSIDQFFEQHLEFDELYIRTCEQEQKPLSEYRAAFIEAGLGLLGIPEEHGGVPVDTQTLVMAAEKIGEHGFPSGLGSMLQVDDVLAFGTESSRRPSWNVCFPGTTWDSAWA